MFSQREMDKFVNSFERNDHRSNFFRPRSDDHSMSPDRLLATSIEFHRYLEQSVLSAMKRRGWISSDDDPLKKFGAIEFTQKVPRSRGELNASEKPDKIGLFRNPSWKESSEDPSFRPFSTLQITLKMLNNHQF
jgi:hypothetical protein